MKKLLYFSAIIILLFSVQTIAENKITIDINTAVPLPPHFIERRQCDIKIPLKIENDLLIEDFTIAFRLIHSGYIDFDIDQIVLIPGTRAAEGMSWDFEIRNSAESDTAIIIGQSSAPDLPGIAPGPPETMFIISLSVEGEEGDILVDSCTNVDPYGIWSWGTIQPSYDGLFGIVYGFLPCGGMTFTLKPEDDLLSGDHCNGVSFQFHAINYASQDDAVGYGICHFDFIPQITDDGLFTYPPADPGTYPVIIEAWDYCPVYGSYAFDVVLTNMPMNFTKNPQYLIHRAPENTFQLNLGLDGQDCDPLSETVDIISSPGEDPANWPTCTNGVFEWTPTTADLGSWTFEVSSADPFDAQATCQLDVIVTDDLFLCGDANNDDAVNVSDGVYIINYIFVGGPAPVPMESGDTNCDGVISISDVVRIINFVFIEGLAPCDC